MLRCLGLAQSTGRGGWAPSPEGCTHARLKLALTPDCIALPPWSSVEHANVWLSAALLLRILPGPSPDANRTAPRLTQENAGELVFAPALERAAFVVPSVPSSQPTPSSGSTTTGRRLSQVHAHCMGARPQAWRLIDVPHFCNPLQHLCRLPTSRRRRPCLPPPADHQHRGCCPCSGA